MNKYTVIMPVKKDDVDCVKKIIVNLRRYCNADHFVVITSLKNLEKIPNLGRDVEFIDEDQLYPGLSYNTAKEEMIDRGLDAKLTGHCFQQLLKMAYCYTCSGDGYLIWDADTIPVRPITFFNEITKRYIFYMRDEYTPRYFAHLDRILSIEKQVKKSFITEHMYVESNVMKEIVGRIDQNEEVKGNAWWKKIIQAMDNGNGMSEYEIYGNYVMKRNPERYELVEANSLRYGRSVLGKVPTDKQLEWISKEYGTVSIEHFDKETFLTSLSKLSCIMRINPRMYSCVVSFVNRGINKVRRMLK